MRIILLALLILTSSAWADEVKNISELAMLPQYCRGTQQVRDISKDPIPLNQYMAMYGRSYAHLHHYCWALIDEYKAGMMSDKYSREFMLGNALGGIKYVLTNADHDFILLPDIYNSQARMLFSLHRDSEAVLALVKAIELKPSYVPAVARLSDYFAKIGDKALAIKTLETGIDNTENAGGLIKKLAALGVTYLGTPGSAIVKEEQVRESVTPTAPAASQNAASPPSATPSDATQPVQTGSKPATNPYCRFCP